MLCYSTDWTNSVYAARQRLFFKCPLWYAANDLSVSLKCNKYSEQHSQSLISVTWVETHHWAKIGNPACITVNMKRRLFSVVTLEPERNKQFLIKSLNSLYILIVRYIFPFLRITSTFKMILFLKNTVKTSAGFQWIPFSLFWSGKHCSPTPP